MDDCIELKAGIKQLLDYEAALICVEHIQHKVKLADLFERAKAEAFQAGRKVGLGEALTAVDKAATNRTHEINAILVGISNAYLHNSGVKELSKKEQEINRRISDAIYGCIDIIRDEIKPVNAVEALTGGGE